MTGFSTSSYVAPPPPAVLPSYEAPPTGAFLHDTFQSLDRPFDLALLRHAADQITPDLVQNASQMIFEYAILVVALWTIYGVVVRGNPWGLPLPRMLSPGIMICCGILAVLSAGGTFPLTLLAVATPFILHLALVFGMVVGRIVAWPVTMIVRFGRPSLQATINAGPMQQETVQAAERALASLSPSRLALFQARTATVLSGGLSPMRRAVTPEQAAAAVRAASDPDRACTVERWVAWLSAGPMNFLCAILAVAAAAVLAGLVAQWLSLAFLVLSIGLFDLGDSARKAAECVRKEEKAAASDVGTMAAIRDAHQLP